VEADVSGQGCGKCGLESRDEARDVWLRFETAARGECSWDFKGGVKVIKLEGWTEELAGGALMASGTFWFRGFLENM
jgi:hypothetical protein